jgi:hypothetical protein
MLLVLLGAALHAGWNALATPGTDSLLDMAAGAATPSSSTTRRRWRSATVGRVGAGRSRDDVEPWPRACAGGVRRPEGGAQGRMARCPMC